MGPLRELVTRLDVALCGNKEAAETVAAAQAAALVSPAAFLRFRGGYGVSDERSSVRFDPWHRKLRLAPFSRASAKAAWRHPSVQALVAQIEALLAPAALAW